MPQIELIRPLKLNPTGGSELVISNRGANNVFYGESPTVSETNKIGTLNAGESLTLKKGFVWVVAEKSPSGVKQVPVILDLNEYEIVASSGGGGGEETVDPERTAIVYVTTDGSDSNNGGTWNKSKKTIQAALKALPQTGEHLQNGEPVRVGKVILGAATGETEAKKFILKSKFTRSGEATFHGGKVFEKVPEKVKLRKSRGSPYIQVNLPTVGEGAVPNPMTGCSTADVGLILTNPLAPQESLEGAEVLAFWEGEVDSHGIRVNKGEENTVTKVICTATKQWFTLSKAVVQNRTQTLLLGEAAVKTSVGVSIEGQGMMSSPPGVGRKGFKGATVVEDVGDYMSIWMESGSPRKPAEGRVVFRNFSLHAKQRPRFVNKKTESGWGKYDSSVAIWGIYVVNSFALNIDKVHVYGYTGWGAWIGNNSGNEALISNSVFMECGNIEAKIGTTGLGIITGGLYSQGGTAVQTFENNLFLDGFGCCFAVTGGTLLGNVVNHAQPSTYESGGKEKQPPGSGANLFITNPVTPTTVRGGWMEGGRVQVQIQGGWATIEGVHMQGIVSEPGAGGSEGGEGEEQSIPAWSSTEEYNEGDVVEDDPSTEKHASGVWESLQDENLNHKPNVSPEFWAEVTPAEYAIEGAGYFVGNTFKKYQKACIKETGPNPITWGPNRIASPRSERVRGIPFIERESKFADVPLFSAFGFGRSGGREEETGKIKGVKEWNAGTIYAKGAAALLKVGAEEIIYESREKGNKGNKPDTSPEWWTEITAVVGANVFTSPPSEPEEITLETVGLASVQYTNVQGYDVRLSIPVTFEANGKLERKQFASSAWEKTYPTEESTVVAKRTVEIYVRSGETLKLTTNKSSIGAAMLSWV